MLLWLCEFKEREIKNKTEEVMMRENEMMRLIKKKYNGNKECSMEKGSRGS